MGVEPDEGAEPDKEQMRGELDKEETDIGLYRKVKVGSSRKLHSGIILGDEIL